jgi:hypothetical protein
MRVLIAWRVVLSSVEDSAPLAEPEMRARLNAPQAFPGSSPQAGALTSYSGKGIRQSMRHLCCNFETNRTDEISRVNGE